eukprot:XP_001703075.1 predicted protein [Chlamydomonas reinhardtii]
MRSCGHTDLLSRTKGLPLSSVAPLLQVWLEGVTADANAGGSGAALALLGGSLRVVLANRSSLAQNRAAAHGGALAVGGGPLGSLELYDSSTLEYNTVQYGSGAAVHCGGDLGQMLMYGGSGAYGNAAKGSNGFGGVLYATGNVTRIQMYNGSSISGNSAVRSGGALYGASSMGEIVLYGASGINGNSVGTGSGGAIHVAQSLALLRLTDGSSIDNNAAATSGAANGAGGAACAAAGSLLTVTLDGGSSISRNAAKGTGGGGALFSHDRIAALTLAGGAVYCTGGVVSITLSGGSSVSNNSVTGLQRGRGGAIAVDNRLSQLLLTDGSYMVGNVVNNGNGGAVFAATIKYVDLSSGAYVINNQAVGGDGGAVYGAYLLSDVRLTGGAVVDDNAAGGSGGALYSGGPLGSLVLSDEGSSMSRNTAAGGPGGAVAVPYGTGVETAGRVSILSLSGGAAMNDNEAHGGPGGALFAGAAIDAVLIEGGSSVTGNTALDPELGYGGALYAAVGISSITITGSGSSLDGNRSAKEGGAVFCGGPVGLVLLSDGGSMRRNAAAGGNGGAICAAAPYFTNGSALAVPSTAPALSGMGELNGLTIRSGGRLEANSADPGHGGGVACFSGSGSSSPNACRVASVLIDGSSGGRVGGVGGQAAATPSMTTGILNCTARLGNGGGIWVEGNLTAMVMTGRGASLSHNAAVPVSNSGSNGQGGAVFVGGVLGSVTADGGAAISGNRGKSGGAVYAARSLGAVWVLGGSVVDGNVASSSGGALYTAAAALSRNYAGYRGGAVATNGTLGLLEVGPSGGVNDNRARGDGGAVFAAVNLTTLILPPPGPSGAPSTALAWNLADRGCALFGRTVRTTVYAHYVLYTCCVLLLLLWAAPTCMPCGP